MESARQISKIEGFGLFCSFSCRFWKSGLGVVKIEIWSARMKSLDEAARPVRIISAILGVGVIEIPFGSPRLVLSHFYSICVVVTYCFLSFTMYIEDYNMENTMKVAIHKFLIILNFGVTIFSVISSWLRMKVNILNDTENSFMRYKLWIY